MNGSYKIRPVKAADAKQILAVYTPFIEKTCITFETEVPTLQAFGARVEGILSAYPYLVCEAGGRIVGYAYASKHNERGAYRYSANVSVYIEEAFQGKGIGRALYTELFNLMRERGLYTAYAGITVPNEKSVALHAAFGFVPVGTFHKAGFKHGEWHDVMWMEKALRDYGTPEGEI